MDRQEMVKELQKLLQSRNNDAIRLAWFGPEDMGKIGKLDLRGVAEFKRSEKGAFEVRFVDRLKVLDLLERLKHGEEDTDLGEFLKGLRDGEAQ